MRTGAGSTAKAKAVQKTHGPRSGARERLLSAARAEFAAKGFAGASIRGITSLLGMRESSFYAHFPSKQAAYDELFREAGPSVIAELARRRRA